MRQGKGREGRRIQFTASPETARKIEALKERLGLQSGSGVLAVMAETFIMAYEEESEK